MSFFKSKENRKAVLFTAVFLAMLLLPYPLWFLCRPFLDTKNHENRFLAEYPAECTVQQWPAAFESFINDRAPFRNQLMSLHTGMGLLLGSLDSESILLGRDGWLFLKDEPGSRSLSDYQGLTYYSDEEQAMFSDGYGHIASCLAGHGSRLAVFYAPSKEGVYAQYMPASVPPTAGKTKMGTLMERLQQDGIPVLWPQKELQEAGKDVQLYYKYDSHWNHAGAFFAAGLICDLLDVPHTPYDPARISPSQAAPFKKDQAEMCAGWKFAKDDSFMEVQAPKAKVLSERSDGLVMHLKGSGTQTMLLIRDSFGEDLAPYLCESFGDCWVVHNSALFQDILLTDFPTVPDVVIMEGAERYSDNMLNQIHFVSVWLDQMQ